MYVQIIEQVQIKISNHENNKIIPKLAQILYILYDVRVDKNRKFAGRRACAMALGRPQSGHSTTRQLKTNKMNKLKH